MRSNVVIAGLLSLAPAVAGLPLEVPPPSPELDARHLQPDRRVTKPPNPAYFFDNHWSTTAPTLDDAQRKKFEGNIDRTDDRDCGSNCHHSMYSFKSKLDQLGRGAWKIPPANALVTQAGTTPSKTYFYDGAYHPNLPVLTDADKKKYQENVADKTCGPDCQRSKTSYLSKLAILLQAQAVKDDDGSTPHPPAKRHIASQAVSKRNTVSVLPACRAVDPIRTTTYGRFGEVLPVDVDRKGVSKYDRVAMQRNQPSGLPHSLRRHVFGILRRWQTGTGTQRIGLTPTCEPGPLPGPLVKTLTKPDGPYYYDGRWTNVRPVLTELDRQKFDGNRLKKENDNCGVDCEASMASYRSKGSQIKNGYKAGTHPELETVTRPVVQLGEQPILRAERLAVQPGSTRTERLTVPPGSMRSVSRLMENSQPVVSINKQNKRDVVIRTEQQLPSVSIAPVTTANLKAANDGDVNVEAKTVSKRSDVPMVNTPRPSKRDILRELSKTDVNALIIRHIEPWPKTGPWGVSTYAGDEHNHIPSITKDQTAQYQANKDKQLAGNCGSGCGNSIASYQAQASMVSHRKDIKAFDYYVASPNGGGSPGRHPYTGQPTPKVGSRRTKRRSPATGDKAKETMSTIIRSRTAEDNKGPVLAEKQTVHDSNSPILVEKRVAGDASTLVGRTVHDTVSKIDDDDDVLSAVDDSPSAIDEKIPHAIERRHHETHGNDNSDESPSVKRSVGDDGAADLQ